MKKLKNIIALGLLVAFIGGISSCGAGKCNCPKFSLDTEILE